MTYLGYILCAVFMCLMIISAFSRTIRNFMDELTILAFFILVGISPVLAIGVLIIIWKEGIQGLHTIVGG